MAVTAFISTGILIVDVVFVPTRHLIQRKLGNFMKKHLLKTTATVILSIFLALLPGAVHGQILVNDGNTLAEFSAGGVQINTALSTPQGIAISGTNLFVANYGAETIGEYSTSGATNNASLIKGLSGSEGIAISGTNLFVANAGGNIGEYTTSGTTNNAKLITGLINADGIAISGTNLFVAELGRNRIGEYTLSGAIVNTNLIAVPEPNGLAISGNFLFVAGGGGRIGEYTIAGATNNPSLFTVPSSYPFGIVVLPDTGLSLPTTLAASLTATNVMLSWPTNAFAYQLQTSPILAPAVWTVVTNTPIVTNGDYDITLDPIYSSQFFQLQSIN